jgi:hypothetical protein
LFMASEYKEYTVKKTGIQGYLLPFHQVIVLLRRVQPTLPANRPARPKKEKIINKAGGEKLKFEAVDGEGESVKILTSENHRFLLIYPSQKRNNKKEWRRIVLDSPK